MTHYQTASLSPSRGRGLLPGYEIRYTADPPRLRFGAAPSPIREAPARAQLDPQPDYVDCVGVHFSDVDLAARRTADLVLAIAHDALGLPWSIRVHWYRETTGAEKGYLLTRVRTRGFVEPDGFDVAWIKVAPADSQLVRTLAHECRHLWHLRYRRLSTPDADRAALEADAEQWADQVAEAIFFDPLTGMPFRCA